ncbi:hypothetical protein HMPREF1121_01100 [Porphyromonas sp. KLE 1280]|nr:hypothetical protein HMPREF1121_01100 [Porphyromonas sp. KLE 1280]
MFQANYSTTSPLTAVPTQGFLRHTTDPLKGENPHLYPMPIVLREKNLYLRSQTIHYFPFLKAL